MCRTLTAVAVTLALGAPIAGASKNDEYVTRMEKEHSADEPVASSAAEVPPAGEIRGEEVVYATLDDGTGISGYLAHPVSGDDAPGILVIHE